MTQSTGDKVSKFQAEHFWQHYQSKLLVTSDTDTYKVSICPQDLMLQY